MKNEGKTLRVRKWVDGKGKEEWREMGKVKEIVNREEKEEQDE